LKRRHHFTKTGSGQTYWESSTQKQATVFLQGTQFAIANDRRNDAQLYVVCLEVACHVDVSTSADSTVEVRDMEPGAFEQVRNRRFLSHLCLTKRSFAKTGSGQTYETLSGERRVVQIGVSDASGTTASIVVVSSAPIVLAVGNSDADDYAGEGARNAAGEREKQNGHAVPQFSAPLHHRP